jgi:hypothetical protein
MRRLTQIEAGILIIAALFILAGADRMIHPVEELVSHPALRQGRATIEHVTKERAQLYGALAILLGAGLVGLVFYKPGEK